MMKAIMQPMLPGCEEIITAADQQKYTDFVDKFKPKKTTDDCYTPSNIMDAVNAWAARQYGIDPARFVRPFWPGGDYTAFEYPPGSVVVDNPPFSILTQITTYYLSRKQPFFLFGPALTILSGWKPGLCCICTGAQITYENGANVPTSFITNLDPACMRTAPDLYSSIEAANRANMRSMRKELPKYTYPDHVITAAIAQRWCKYGIQWAVEPSQAAFVRALDAQKDEGKTIFGAGFLLSERAAAERAAATQWRLSDRERRIIDKLSGREPQQSLLFGGNQHVG